MIAEERLSVQLACRLLDVTRSGYYAAASRPPSARSIRQAWLTDLIRQIHAASRGTYGAPRVHAELRMGRGITVGHKPAGLRPGLRRSHAVEGRDGPWPPNSQEPLDPPTNR